MSSLVRATPFHSRAAAACRRNLWEPREGWTVVSVYDDAGEEALAARLTAALADISWRWRVAIEGKRSEEFLARLLTRNPASLEPGSAFKALWLTDKGAIRGAGLLARNGRESFTLISTASDPLWIAKAAALFDVAVHEIGEAQGLIALVGPYSAKLVAAAGLDPGLAPLRFRKQFWGGLDVTLSRFGEHEGYEIGCSADDAALVWDRLTRAGQAYALKPAGAAAMDILDLEAGVPRPGRDYIPARGGFVAAPKPAELGLEPLIEPDHFLFNGRAGCMTSASAGSRMGIVLDSDIPAPNMTFDGGRTLGSAYSPALRSAIALAMVESSVTAGQGIRLEDGKKGKVVDLPFLPAPVPLPL